VRPSWLRAPASPAGAPAAPLRGRRRVASDLSVTSLASEQAADATADAGRPSGLDICVSELGYPGGVTKRLIGVDDAKLEAVKALLGTSTLKATVDEAFNEVLALAERRRTLLAGHGVSEAALRDPEARRAAWG